jgi:hypothetical protein
MVCATWISGASGAQLITPGRITSTTVARSKAGIR